MDREGLHLVISHLRRLVSPEGHQTDRHLLESYLSQRDEAAFTALVQRHGSMIYGLALRLLRDAHAAEDVFQATFLILASKAHTIRRQDSVGSWLYGVAHRLAMRVRQTSKRWESDTRSGVPMPPENPEAIVRQRELESVLDEELKELSERLRAPLLLCYLEGQTQDEAARQLGWSKATLRRRLERGRELLRARLVRRGITLSVGLLTTALANRAEASVLSSLVHKTAVASMQAALGATNAVSPSVAALADWGMKTLIVSRKFLTLWLLATALVTTGGGVTAYALTQSKPEPPPILAPVAVKNIVPANRASLSAVWSAAYSPNGLLLATGSGNADDLGTLAVWDVPTGKVRLWLEQPRGVRSVVFSPDSRKIATAGWDNSARIYDVRNGKILALLKGHRGPINGLAFSPDGKTLASASLDSHIHLWDVEKGTLSRKLSGHDNWVMGLAFLPGGKSLVSAGKDATVRIWNVETGAQRLLVKLERPPNIPPTLKDWEQGTPIECVAVSPDGQTIATGDWDDKVCLWDVATGQLRRALLGHKMGVLFVSFSPDGKMLASVSGSFNEHVGGEVKLWNLADGRERATLKGHTDSVWSVRFSPDGRSLVTASRDEKAKVWEVATGQERMTLENGLELFDGKLATPLTGRDREEIWKVLAVEDAKPAQRAISQLVRAPEQAVPWLAEQLRLEPKATAAQEKRIQELLVQLDDDDFNTREQATAELLQLGLQALPALRQALNGKLSVEVRQRIDGVLAKLSKTDQLRGLRAVEALELMNTAEARQVLQDLAEGAPEAFLTQEAKASYQRLSTWP
jgi:RNA polymerase sigma factor (sigma-70 family)